MAYNYHYYAVSRYHCCADPHGLPVVVCQNPSSHVAFSTRVGDIGVELQQFELTERMPTNQDRAADIRTTAVAWTETMLKRTPRHLLGGHFPLRFLDVAHVILIDLCCVMVADAEHTLKGPHSLNVELLTIRVAMTTSTTCSCLRRATIS